MTTQTRGAARLGPGDAAPVVVQAALDGTAIHVPAAGSWTLLSFLRYASCPMCNLRVRELTYHSATLASQGVSWVAVFHSPAARLERHFRDAARSRVLADPKRVLYQRYGVERSWWGLLFSMLVPSFYWRFVQATVFGYWGGMVDDSFHSMPADFLISPDGVVRRAYYGKHIGDHLSVPAVLAAAHGSGVA